MTSSKKSTGRKGITQQRSILKTTFGQSGFLFPKFQHLGPFREKRLLYNTTVIC